MRQCVTPIQGASLRSHEGFGGDRKERGSLMPEVRGLDLNSVKVLKGAIVVDRRMRVGR